MAADAKQFEVSLHRVALTFGNCSSPFLEDAFRTVSYRIAVTVNACGGWSNEEDTVLAVRAQACSLHHTDRNSLRRIVEPTPNPLMRGSTQVSAPRRRGMVRPRN